MKDMLELISRYLDHALTPDEMRELGDWIKSDPAHARQFAEQAFIHGRLRDVLVGEQFLREQNEPESAVASATQQKVSIPQAFSLKRRTRSMLPWLIAAAVVLIASLLMFSRSGKSQQNSSTITLAMAVDAVWDGPPPDADKPLALPAPLHLESGCVKFLTADGGSLIFEGPATFTLKSPRAVALGNGRLTARMPGGGLVVETPDARITDLGTEFGINADPAGSHVEVFEGRVQAALGTGPTQAITLTSQQAANIATGRVVMDPAGARPQRFVRTLARDISQLDVVDLISGGDGTSHRCGVGIDMKTGDWGELPAGGEVIPDGQYHRVPSLPVTDGVFIPDSAGGPATIDSAGHQFNSPTSYRGSFMPLWAGGPIPLPPPGNAPISSTLAGVDYSQGGHGLLMMHANKGLTLDLAAIRRLHPGQSLTRFVSLVGNTRLANDNPPAAASVYVLVDGQLRFSREAFTARNGAISVDVQLEPKDRFLTLVVTDGGDLTITFDHVIWADPALKLSMAK